MIGIVILNWNGYEDTIECLNSIIKSTYQDFVIYLIDNNSSDESVSNLNSYIIQNQLDKKIILMPQSENLGFAKGSNVGIKQALCDNCEFVWLLNNDTIIEENTIEELISALEDDKRLQVITPCITYYEPSDIVWNCGGKLSKIGFRKYFYANQKITSVPSQNFQISFLTNCASMFDSSYFKKYGLLSENFFFGEEDFEMCLRNKKNKIKMSCIPSARIYHKVGRSIGNEDFSSRRMINKQILYYVNRYVDMKLHFKNSLIFFIYRKIYNLYIKKLLVGKNMPLLDVKYVISKVEKYSTLLTKVDGNTFKLIMEL